jgi:hypothetical protein
MKIDLKKPFFLISIGLLNLLHGFFHVIQFIQSMLLVVYSTHHHHEHSHGWLESFLHNPFWAFLWMIVGILTMIIGIRDYKHHKDCEND